MIPPLPTVTFITPTLNSEATLYECISSIDKLDYPRNRIKMFIMDDGSTDDTLKIAKKFHFCKTFQVKTSGPEEATAIGINHAKSDYIVNFSSDNVIPTRDWLKKMLFPLEKNPNLTAAESINYTHRKRDKVLNRYFALFGMNDPVAFYLDKRDRRAYYETGWHLPTHAVDYGSYYEASFTKENMPTLGANGCIFRTKTIRKVTKDPKLFSHIDSCVDLLRLGSSTYAFVKVSLWHKSGETLFHYFYKRRHYALVLYFNKKHHRRYHLYNPPHDRFKLIRYVVYSLTLIEPLIQSIRGYYKVRDLAWFLHPAICFLTTVNYFLVVVKFRVHRATGRF